MKTVSEHIRFHLLHSLGVFDSRPPYEELVESEWCQDFECYMRNRLILGALRYSLLHDKDAPPWNNIGSIISRAEKYLKDGNQEHLVDIANLSLIEFVRPSCHPNPHFSPDDSRDPSIVRTFLKEE